jgi:tetratricopeptide (TPR) repeat protein
MRNLLVPLFISMILSGCDGQNKRHVGNDFEKSLAAKSNDELYKYASDLYDKEADDKAIIAFQNCIDRGIKLDTSYFKQGVCLIDINQVTDGITKLEQALKINPQYFKACFNIGAKCYDIKQYGKSIEYYQKAAQLKPKDDASYYGIAASQYALGKYDEAKKNCRIALDINPKNEYANLLRSRLQQNY